LIIYYIILKMLAISESISAEFFVVV